MRSWVLVGHVCNPNYLRDRDKKDRGLKPAQANSSGDLISSKPTTKKGGGMAQGVGPEFKSKYQKKKTPQKYEGTEKFRESKKFVSDHTEVALQCRSISLQNLCSYYIGL
jgi:hypothetical protein